MKKILALGVILTLLMSALPFTCVAAETGDTVTKLVNVAKNKPATTEHSRSESYNPNVITDDNLTSANFWYGYVDSSTKPYITIDLERRYKIEKIRIFDRGDVTMPTRGQFEIWGADKADFSDARMLFELNDNSLFPEKYDYIAELGEKPVARYIRYQAKNAAVVYLREIQVFATVTATEITRKANTYTTTNIGSTGMGGDKLVDNDFGDSSAIYLKNVGNDESMSGIYSSFTIDLDSPKHVDMIEMYNRRGGGATDGGYRGNFTLYGSGDGTIKDFTMLSSDGVTPYGKIDKTAFEAILAEDGETKVYKKITSIDSAVSDYTAKDGSIYCAFPNRADNDDRACYQTMLSGGETYRYLTYRKNKTAIGTGANLVQIVEFRAYQIHPEIYDISYADGKITLEFSEEMDYEALVNAITVTDKEKGKAVEGISTEKDDLNPYKAVITLPEIFDATLKIRVTNDAENTKGVSLSKIYDKEIALPSAINTEEAGFTDEYGTVISLLAGKTKVCAKVKLKNNSSSAERLLMIVSAYDANHTLKAIKVLDEKIDGKASGKEFSAELITQSAFLTGDYVTVHLWNGLDNIKSWNAMQKLVAE